MTTAKRASKTQASTWKQAQERSQCGHMTSKMVFGVYREISIVEPWGSDPRYGRCKRCGAMVADSRVSSRPVERDYYAESITTRRNLHGVKPDGFYYWLFRILNLRAGDTLADKFPGSGSAMRCWEVWRRQQPTTERKARSVRQLELLEVSA